jgi:DNA repair protein RecO
VARSAPPPTNALVLRWVAYGETSQIVHLATAERGLVPALAKGSLRPGSACQGGLATAMLGRATIRPRRVGGLDLLTAFRLERAHLDLARDLERWHAGQYVLELLRLWLHEDLPAPDLYRAGVTALDVLERAPRDQLPAWIVWFEARALAAGGHQPVLEACAVCGRREGGALWFHPGAGGLVHGACRPPGEARRLPPADRQALERLYTARLGALAREPLDPRGVAAARAVHDLFVPWVLERRPRLLPGLPRPGQRPRARPPA